MGKIEIVEGDITREKVDVIVNAATKHADWQHIAGAAGESAALTRADNCGLLALQGPVRLNFVAQRDIPGTDLGVSFIKGLANNSSAEQIRRYTPASNRLIEIFSGRPKLSPGETFAMEYLPGKGTTFYIEGQPQGAPLGDAEYFGMVLRIWLGSVPVDHQLKEALLR